MSLLGRPTMVTIAVANQKGGVGKTTLTFNLAKFFSTQGMTTLAVDNDPQANLTSSFLQSRTDLQANILNAYEEKPVIPQKVSENLYLIGSDITLATVAERDFEIIYRLREALEQVQNDALPMKFDCALIDCLPSVGYLHLAALNAADYVLIPIKLAPYALAGINDLFATIRKARRRLNRDLQVLGIVLNQVDGRKPILERELEAVLRQNYGSLVFSSKLNKRIRFEESPAFRLGILEYRPKGNSAIEFKSFARELLQKMGMNSEERSNELAEKASVGGKPPLVPSEGSPRQQKVVL
jgi:chromosome partitioning protein